jgi:DMATS type aromatic prenyltransferase
MSSLIARTVTGMRAQDPARKLGDYAKERFCMLCEASGFEADSERVTKIFSQLIEPWAEQRIEHDIGWRSDIADDNTPIEFSVAISKHDVEVRALFETQADEPTLPAFREVGIAFQERLEREFGASLERFRLVQDLFLPEDMEGEFAVWNSAVFPKHKAPSFKAYLNPHARGVDHSHELVKEGLARLGLGNVWSTLKQTILRRGPQVDELKYFALDLNKGAESRVKVYVRHHDASAEDLEVAASAAENYVPGETRSFVRAMSGDVPLLHPRAAFTCSSFVQGSTERPVATTVYVPVCAYARDDARVLERVLKYLRDVGIDSSRYEAIVRGFANRPLQAGVGLQPWFAFRRHGGVRITSYLATEAYHVHAPGTVPAPTARDSGVGVVLRT